ncbi:hypothetical protein ACS0TY_010664 [Phlomoides rotata]
MEDEELPSASNNGVSMECTDIVRDYTDIFTTTALFESRDELIKWVRDAAKPHRMVVVIKRSDNGFGKKKARLLLGCERGGEHREVKGRSLKSNVDETDDMCDLTDELDGIKKSKKIRDTRTKKCGCQFLLRGRQVEFIGDWDLEVICEGHSYAGRLTKEEEEYVIDMSTTNIAPKIIMKQLKTKFKENSSIMKNIYNACTKHMVVERAGRSQIQYLMGKLKDHKYLYLHKRCEKTDTIRDLFFAHPKSIDLVSAFPKVLLMDCTYNTNRYRMPLLEIVGVTPTNLTFCVACAFMNAEREDNYTWPLSTLRSLVVDLCLPNLIITDRELALMRAVESIIPTTSHILCRWHINRNIMATCKKYFPTKEHWNNFYSSWCDINKADEESRFNELLRRFVEDYSNKYPNAVKYDVKNWIDPYKEKFVSCWTNNILHYGNTTTNRVEGHHSALKRQLKTSIGDFETCWTQMHTLYQASHTAVKDSFEKSINVVQHKFKSNVFKELRGMISIVALDKILEESERGTVDPLLCGCTLRKSYGLPCGHEISKFVAEDCPILIDVVDGFWRKLDMKPLMGNDVKEDCHARWTECIAEANSKYDNSSPSEQLEAVNPITTPLIEPNIVIRTRGHPKSGILKHQKSTKRNPSVFELLDASITHSNSPMEGVVFDVGPSAATPMFTNNKRQRKKIRGNISVRWPRFRSSNIVNTVESLPKYIKPHINRTSDVHGDGHCGFRAIGELVGYIQDSWSRVRCELTRELLTNLELYDKVFMEKDWVDKVLDVLNCYDDYAEKKHWFTLPDMGYLVASAYDLALISLSPQLSLTFLPLKTEAPTNPIVISIAFVNQNHFIHVCSITIII